MAHGLNNAERFVHDLCSRGFLSLWSAANPQGKNPGKELCDVIVVCSPHIILISVKDIVLGDDADSEVRRNRWQRKAVDESVKQLRGAHRWLRDSDHIKSRDGSHVFLLPPPSYRRYHLVAVACGGRNKVTLKSAADADDPMIHVVDEQSFFLLIRHLDTITDFTAYLTAKEELVNRASVVISGGEENLLALYLSGDRRFPLQGTFFLVEGDLWDKFCKMPQFLAKLKEDEESYIWDNYIETHTSVIGADGQPCATELTNAEAALRVLAREDRFSRRMLGRALREFINSSDTVRSRCVKSWANTGYVFFTYDSSMSLKERRAELTARCFASLFHFAECPTVIGMSFNKRGEVPVGGSSADLILLHRDVEAWPHDCMEKARVCRDDLGFFKNPNVGRMHGDEYPEKGIPTKRSSVRRTRPRCR